VHITSNMNVFDRNGLKPREACFFSCLEIKFLIMPMGKKLLVVFFLTQILVVSYTVCLFSGASFSGMTSMSGRWTWNLKL
jgi:hypothetical protein